MKSQISIAIVGCGYWGSNHVRVMHELGTTITLCDSSSSRISLLQKQYPEANATTSYSNILSNDTINAVVISTPAETHYDLAQQALLSGKHVLVEKPMALEPTQATELINLSRQQNTTLMVGHLMRFHPAIIKLKELVDKGELGKLQYMYSTRLNMGKVRREENALWSFAPHDISITLHLKGKLPKRVSATGGAYLQPSIADISLSSMEFDDGTRSHIFVSWLHPYKEQKLVVVGDRRMAVFDDSEPMDKLGLFDGEIKLIDGNFVTNPPQRSSVSISSEEPLVTENRHFLHCIETGESPITNGVEGLEVLKVLKACQESLMQGGYPTNL